MAFTLFCVVVPINIFGVRLHDNRFYPNSFVVVEISLLFCSILQLQSDQLLNQISGAMLFVGARFHLV